jgi:protein-S-isoprenylcysteine O-methyltransferase Ste14
MLFRASEAEFRYRFWVIFGLFAIAFYCYRIDHKNAAAALLHVFRPGLDLDAGAGRLALQTLFLVGAAIAGIGAVIRSWATAYLRSEIVHDASLHSDRLVADGPYRHVRNPLYVGNILLSLGMSLLTSRLGAAVLILGQAWFLRRLIGREEYELGRTGGASYAAFLAAVPRLLPSLRPRVPASGQTPRWVQGIGGEAFMWILVAAMIAFAVTLQSRIVPVMVGIGLLVYGAVYLIGKRKLHTATD